MSLLLPARKGDLFGIVIAPTGQQQGVNEPTLSQQRLSEEESGLLPTASRKEAFFIFFPVVLLQKTAESQVFKSSMSYH